MENLDTWFDLDSELVNGPEETILVVTQPGIYTLVVTDDTGCSVSQAISFDNSQVQLDYEQAPLLSLRGHTMVVQQLGTQFPLIPLKLL